jgi:diguanylate cyclase (GGDEF)-like protein
MDEGCALPGKAGPLRARNLHGNPGGAAFSGVSSPGKYLAGSTGFHYTYAISAGNSPIRGPGVADEKILVVHREKPARRELVKLLSERGFQPVEAASSEEALKKLEKDDYAVVLLDVGASGPGPVKVVGHFLHVRPEQTIVVLAPAGSMLAGAALTRGAHSVIPTPVQPADLEIGLRNALERYDLQRTNALLRQETLQDDLTGVLNRRYLDRYLGEEIERARRYKHPFSLLFFDLDHLKNINDQFGHLSGSRVLVEVVDVIKTKLRRADKIFRFGGDEFCVTLPETDLRGAVGTAHRLRRAIRSHRFRPVDDAEASLTASFGVAAYPDNGETGEALLRHADAAMYLVKNGTRDGVGVKETP